MAKLIPDHIDQNDPRRNGERLVFEWLSNDAVPGTVYYSLLQKNHRHKLIGEVDFLYVCDRGFLCIEVKGGQGQHWVAIDSVNGTNIKMLDPGSKATNLWKEYDYKRTSMIQCFKKK